MIRRYPPCAKHAGKHQDVNGQCVHWGAPVALRPGVCLECGAPIFNRLTFATGRVDKIEEGTDELHRHAAPIRVELDPQQLADAIVAASRAARQDRKSEAEPKPQDGTLRTPEGTYDGG